MPRSIKNRMVEIECIDSVTNEKFIFVCKRPSAADHVGYGTEIYEALKQEDYKKVADARVEFGSNTIQKYNSDQFLDENDEPITQDRENWKELLIDCADDFMQEIAKQLFEKKLVDSGTNLGESSGSTSENAMSTSEKNA